MSSTRQRRLWPPTSPINRAGEDTDARTPARRKVGRRTTATPEFSVVAAG